MASSREVTIPANYAPRGYQMPFLSAMDRCLEPGGIKRACLVWHRRAGKDKTAIAWTASQAYQRKGTYFHCLPTYNQGRKVVWDGIDAAGFRFIDHFPPEVRSNKNESEMRIELKNGSAWQIIGADNYDAVVGSNPVGIVFSEWAISDDYPAAWDLFRPMLAENGGWAVFIFTPRGRNHGFSLYQMAQTNPNWFCQLLTVDDTGVVSKADIQAERDAGMGEGMIQQEFYCSFLASTEDIVIPFELIQASIGRDVAYSGATKIAGLDVARFGDDRTALVVRQGPMVTHVETWSQADAVQTAGRVMDRYRARLMDVVSIDAIGIGSGVVDILRNNGIPVVAVNVAETPTLNDARYQRLRDELWWKARMFFEDRTCGISRGIMPKDINALLADIQDIHYGYTPTGKIRIEEKAEMKKRLGFSPDIGDALCLTFAAEGRFMVNEAMPARGKVGFGNWKSRGQVNRKWSGYKEVYV